MIGGKEKAEARVKRIEARLLELNEEARMLRSELSVLESYLAVDERLKRAGPDEPLQVNELTRGDPKRGQNPHWTETVEASLKLVAEAGRPLRADELLERLAKLGLVIAGKDPRNVLATALWRDHGQRIVRLGKRGYWPANKEPPDAST